jgi:competence protein ComEC
LKSVLQIAPRLDLRELPALVLAVSAAVGVALALYIALSPSALLFVSALVFVAAVVLVWLRVRFVGLAFVCLFFLMIGGYRASYDLARTKRQAVAALASSDSSTVCIGRVIESPRQIGDHWSVLLAHAVLSCSDTSVSCNPLRVRIVADSVSFVSLRVNDLVCVQGCLHSTSENARRSVGALVVSLTERIVGTIIADSGAIVVQAQSGLNVSRETERLRDRIITCFEKTLSPDAAALCKALVLGERGDFSDEFSKSLRITGLSHIFALSGMNVGFLVVLVWLLLSALCLPRRLRLWLLLGFILLYMELGREEPSLVRACLMAGLFVFGRLMQRNATALNIVLAAAFIELLWRPLDLISAGFTLSYLAVFGIIAGYDVVRDKLLRRLAWMPRGVVDVAAATMVTQLATVAMQTTMFGRLPLLGLAANLLAVPAFAILLLWSVLLLLATAVAPPLAALVGSSLNVAAFGLGQAIEFFASLPLASLSCEPFPLWVTLALLMSAMLVLGGLHTRQKKLVLAGSLVAMNALLWSAILAPHKTGSITFLDVGNGDATLITSSSGRHVLVDAGPHYGDWSAATRINQYLAENRIAALDAMILTHNDEDHIGGCAELLRSVPAKMLLMNGEARATLTENEIKIVARSKGICTKRIVSGQVMTLGEHERLFVLWPDSTLLHESALDNRKSVVLLADFSGIRALLTGDADSVTEHDLARWTTLLRADLLKVGHHGSKSSTAESFLEKVQPSMAVISVGKRNRYGHPSAEVVQRLAQARIQTYRTSQAGNIRLVPRGKGWKREETRAEQLVRLWKLPNA